MSPASGEKICVICGESCADKPRVKDPKGRYYCRACYDQAQQRRKAKKDESHATSTDEPTQPEASSEHEQEPQPAVDDMPDFSDPPPLADDDRDMGPFDKSLLEDDEIGLEGEGGGGSAGMDNCPGCGAALPADAVLCVQCGFNLQTGEAVKPNVEAHADDDTEDDAAAEIGEVPAGATKWPSVVGVISIIFGGLFLLSALLNSAFGAMTLQDPMEVIGIIVGLFIAAAIWIWPVWGGYGLLRRQSGGVRMLKIWSIAMIAVVGGLLVLFAISIPFVGAAITEAMEEMTEGGAGGLPVGEMAMALLFGITAILAVIFLAWPTFLLLWFRREAVKSEVGRWSSSDKV